MSRFTKLDHTGAALPVESEIFAAVHDALLNVEWHPTSIAVENWQEAQDKAVALGDDWRCPTVDELCTLPDRSKRQPAIDTTFFPDTKKDWYWSSSPVVGWPEGAWLVDFHRGVYYYRRDASGFVRPVRAARARQ